MVAALKRENVLIMRCEANGSMTIGRSELNPQGLGIAGILTSLFGLSTTIDQPTLDKITRRIELHSNREQWNTDKKENMLNLPKN